MDKLELLLILILAGIFLPIVLSVDTNEEPKYCRPGSQVLWGCHPCLCSKDGKPHYCNFLVLCTSEASCENGTKKGACSCFDNKWTCPRL